MKRWWLATLVVLLLGQAFSLTPDSHCHINIRNLASALQRYAADHEAKFPTDLGVLAPDYMTVVPRACPVTRLAYHYQVKPRPEGFEVMCLGRAHQGHDLRATLAGVEADFLGPELKGNDRRQADRRVNAKVRSGFIFRHKTRLTVLLFFLLGGLLALVAWFVRGGRKDH